MSGSRIRFFILCTALAVTVLAIVYPTPEQDVAVVASVSSSRNSKTPSLVKKVDSIPRTISEDDLQQIDDPFAPRGWVPVPVMASPIAASVITVTSVNTAPVGPPPIPYRFLGRLVDGADLVVYLGRGEQTFVVKLGETLEGIYKVIRIDETSMEFEHLPTNEKQILSLE